MCNPVRVLAESAAGVEKASRPQRGRAINRRIAPASTESRLNGVKVPSAQPNPSAKYRANKPHRMGAPTMRIAKVDKDSTGKGHLKTVTSRRLRAEFKAHLRGFYWKPILWNKAYAVMSVGPHASLEIVMRYIQDQNSDIARGGDARPVLLKLTCLPISPRRQRTTQPFLCGETGSRTVL